jgi:hypothetical protein
METLRLTTWQYLSVLETLGDVWVRFGPKSRYALSGPERLERALQMARIFSA